MRATISKYRISSVILFSFMHLACLTVFFVPFRWSWIELGVALYFLRMFGITAGYHRYFSHRSYKLGRVWQFLMAFLAETSAQKGVLWWAAHHREHHQNSDTADDVHSPMRMGFWWAHMGWIISNQYKSYEPRMVQDFGKFPELRWLDRYYIVPPAILGALVYLLGGSGAFVWGFVVSTIALFHGTFTSIRWRMSGAVAASILKTLAATISGWPSSRWARAGTTITTNSCMPAVRGCGGGNWISLIMGSRF